MLSPTPGTRIVVRDGQITVIREQDAEPVVRRNADARANNPRGMKQGGFMRWKGSIPNVFIEREVNEHFGLDFVRMRAKERQAAMLELMNRRLADPDYKDFRTSESAPGLKNARGLGERIYSIAKAK